MQIRREARRLAFVLSDVAAWYVALYVAATLRYENIAELSYTGVAVAGTVALVAQVLVGRTVSGSYRGRHCAGTVEDAISVSGAAGLVSLIVFVVNLLLGAELPRSVPFIAAPIALLLHVAARLAVRLIRERRARPDYRKARRVIVFGAGPDGQQLVRSMRCDREGSYLPVAVLDDNQEFTGRWVSGVPVRGTSSDTDRVAAASGADLLVIADRGADAECVRRVAGAARTAGLGVKILPPLAELLRPWKGVADLRDLDITDFLGRRPVHIDVRGGASYLTNRRVLVTGAGGSIGAELCRQVTRFGPAELLMLDRDESALHAVQLSIYGRALLNSPDVILADIRDAHALTDIFIQHRPEVVFHAAALKHLPMLEQYPEEAWKSNVVGTQNVLDAARIAQVDRLVNISTDKAANPISVLGLSKRVGERLVAQESVHGPGTFLSVRFGNVLGSRGSVLTTFTEQLSAGVPITVTDPDVTRFFMTIPEAVQLVIYAAAIGHPGEVLVLDMGSPVRIADVARQLMTVAGRYVEIVYTGLRQGEKLHEELFGDGEIDARPIHPLVSHVQVPAIDPQLLFARQADVGSAVAMREIGGATSTACPGDEVDTDLDAALRNQLA
ncbi:MAG TPA: nucleoside-diphosphate sugar epimerase/dehydratase [Pseudonocardia sp.]|jgi:FlaA1/EpsC-like NDP-sugar epimerase|nr:nucleoside-diphosphate sugar epimerase/dehydratase [Pseudonocardia sp.]